jgi:hypothetical protein
MITILSLPPQESKPNPISLEGIETIQRESRQAHLQGLQRAKEGPHIFIYMCFLFVDGNRTYKLAYTSSDPVEFTKNAGLACREMSQHVKSPSGPFIGVTWCGENDFGADAIGMFSVSKEGKLYPYLGGGLYGARAMGVKTLEKYAALRLARSDDEILSVFEPAAEIYARLTRSTKRG